MGINWDFFAGHVTGWLSGMALMWWLNRPRDEEAS